jgi:hypothetical protein
MIWWYRLSIQNYFSIRYFSRQNQFRTTILKNMALRLDAVFDYRVYNKITLQKVAVKWFICKLS